MPGMRPEDQERAAMLKSAKRLLMAVFRRPLSAFLVMLWLASFVIGFQASNGRTWACTGARGAVVGMLSEHDYSTSFIGDMLPSGFKLLLIEPEYWHQTFWVPDYQSGYGLRTVKLPFWYLLPIALARIGLAFFKKKPVIGSCPQCEYLLTGNLSGKCPECGHRITQRETEKLPSA